MSDQPENVTIPTTTSNMTNGKHHLNGNINDGYSSINDLPHSTCSSIKNSDKIDAMSNIKFISPKKKKKAKSTPSLSYFKLFRYSTICERFWIFVALVCATISSVGMPFNVILYGEFTTLLVDRKLAVGTSTETLVLGIFGGGQQLTNATQEENSAATHDDAVAYGLGTFTITLLQFIFAALSVDLLNATALKQISRIRMLFFKSVLRQDMAWYDLNSDDNFAVKITEDLEKTKEGIGEKLAMCIYLIMSFVVSVVFSFVYGWKLTLVVLSCAPIIVIATAFVAKMQATLSEKELKSYSSAGCVAEEVFGGIRTVVAFGGEDVECERYNARLKPAEINGNRKGYFTGLGGGVMWFIVYCCYALAFWYGVSLILDDRYLEVKEYTPAVLIIVLFGVLVGAQNLGFTSPHLEAFATARASAASIFSIIERLPEIDSLSDAGLQPDKIEGLLEFKNVHFSYPARSDVKVLSGLNLKITPGQTVALVGESGNGKSTCLHLLQRLYDPMHGTISVDGVSLTDLNLGWLRSKIGVVGQEPVLFATSIGENIRYGHPDATQEEIESAAKTANCHAFITKLPNGYNTMVGERGAQLSGGQKQRIAIARALVRNPKILLLDEATSALDMQSERIVQNALDRACAGRTTLVVSHRLSTVTNADQIVLMSKGQVAEQGTHSELMALQGMYYDLVVSSGATTKKVANSQAVKSSDHDEKDASAVSVEEDSDTESTEMKNVEADNALVENTTKSYNVSFWRILKLNSPEWPYILGGAIAAIITGASFPSFAILFGEMYGILSYPDVAHVRSESQFYSLMFLVLGCVAGLGTFFQTALFNTAGVRLTSRLRQMTFKAMISQEMGWFDDTKNSVGALCARLSSDCAGVQGAIGVRLSNLFQAASTILIGVTLAFCFSWELTLVSIIAIPVVIFTVYFESQFMESSNVKEKEATENATKLAVEAISNIRTVASLGQERYVVERYSEEISHVEKACRKKTRLRGIVFAMGQAMPLMGYALALWYGGTLVARGEILYQDVIKVSEALIFGSWMLGQSLAYAPNVGVAMLSAGRIIRILDRVPNIANRFPKIWNTDVETKGNIVYDSVDFRYPTRPNIPVLQNLKLNIQSGQTVALVGPSGCGKSTCIQLLLRYYDADSGTIAIDDKKTIDYSTHHIRQQLGLVSQEPILFDRTIAENIAYGDNARPVSMTEIVEAARLANIHEFIINLPKGYETSLGSKGAQLSGGQKQRIAIARALVRNPRILLLDEATSALDNQSEKIVQKALDQAKSGRTCITIAHRLTTIQNADLICVLDGGKIVEHGRHDELMQLGNRYANLYTMQQVES